MGRKGASGCVHICIFAAILPRKEKDKEEEKPVSSLIPADRGCFVLALGRTQKTATQLLSSGPQVKFLPGAPLFYRFDSNLTATRKTRALGSFRSRA